MTDSTPIPPSLRRAAAALGRAQGEERKLREVFEQTQIPMVMVDGRRRYADANGPARLTFRLNIDELRGYAVDDLTPPHMMGALEQIWERLLTAGWVTGSYPVAGVDGSRFEVVYYALANALPGLHLGAFAPAHWPEDELDLIEDPAGPPLPLSPREVEVLTLAARGFSGPEIAEQLIVSPATIKTHFAHIYEKLEVRSRAAAVATAIQLGVIE
jgi:DNA-binding CsgD family transcriptional regulator